MLIVFISFQKALGVTKTDHRHIEYNEVHDLLTNFLLIHEVKNFENMLVKIFVAGPAEIHGTSIKLNEVDLLVTLLT